MAANSPATFTSRATGGYLDRACNKTESIGLDNFCSDKGCNKRESIGLDSYKEYNKTESTGIDSFHIDKGYNKTCTESIGLDSYRSDRGCNKTESVDIPRGADSLRRIHAQSSAETSGIGDSLQRIHALSSTETSGYGDGDIFCGSPSPEYQGGSGLGSTYDPHYDARLKKTSPEFRSAFKSLRSREFMRAHSTESKHNNEVNCNQLRIDCDQPGSSSADKRQTYRRSRSEEKSAYHRVDQRAGKSSPKSNARSDYNNKSSPNSGSNKKDKSIHNTGINVRSNKKDKSSPDSGSNVHSNTKDYNTKKVDPVIMSIDAEVRNIAGRHNDTNDNNNSTDGGGIKRSGSLTSLGSGSRGFFLGRHSKSTWMTWSQDRRASFKRRMVSMEERQKEMEENRVSTPILKARKESVMFVAPGIQPATLPSEDDLIVHERLQSYVPSSKARRCTDEDDDIKLSAYQWKALVTYWEHPMFIKCRWGGIFLASCALVLTIICLTNQEWSLYPDHDFYGASHSGLWLICSSTIQTKNCTTVFDRDFHLGLLESCLPAPQASPQASPHPCNKTSHWLGNSDSSGHWQYAVIGLLIFSVAFGFLATMLAFCGICTAALPRKLYYYHSAGEIYFICALAVLAAVLIYPVAMESEAQLTSHQYGHGYMLTWVAIVIFLTSSLCMCLDELMRTLTKLCLTIQKRRTNSRV